MSMHRCAFLLLGSGRCVCIQIGHCEFDRSRGLGRDCVSVEVASSPLLRLLYVPCVLSFWLSQSEDNRLLGQHWSFDPGAEDFTRELHARVSSVAVLGRFSRLLCDPNRAVGSDTMFRDVADSLPVHLNAKGKLDGDEVKKRLDALYYPYHQALKKVFDAVQPTIILSPHRLHSLVHTRMLSVTLSKQAARSTSSFLVTFFSWFVDLRQFHAGVRRPAPFD